MLYKKNYRETLKRLNDLYAGNGRDCIYAKMNVKNPMLENFKESHTDGNCGYPDIEERIRFWDSYLEYGSDIDDDSIPGCYLTEVDEGLYGGLVGAEVRFICDTQTGWISSMAVPYIKDLSETEKFEINQNNIWFQRYIDQLNVYIEKSKNKFGISHFILINGLNFLFEIRGATNTYYDVIENPAAAKKVINFSTMLNIWVQDNFFRRVGLYEGGTCSNMAQWVPGRIISESVDPFHLTSTEMFEEWGREPIERAFAHYDGGIVHIHSNGHHLIENVSRIKGLKAIRFFDDEFNPPCHLKLEELSAKCGGVPAIVSIPFDVFMQKLMKKELPGNVLYDVDNVPDKRTANDVMKEIKR